MTLRQIATRAPKLLATALAAVALFTNVHADTILVTSTADDGSPGTLRAALAASNDGDVIDATGVSGTILLTAGELLVEKSVDILGPGPANLTIDGDQISRVYSIAPGLAVTIDGFKIVNGVASGAPTGSPNRGGGIYNGHSSLRVSNCTIADCSATELGGGIYNDGAVAGNATLTVLATLLINNSADGGGGIFSTGGLGGEATLIVADSWLIDNTAIEFGSGGGIFNTDSKLNVSDSTLSGNLAGGSGGGIFHLGPSGNATVTRCTLSGNLASDLGGGICTQSGTLAIADSTLSGNSALRGGGIINVGSEGRTATLAVANCTLSGNAATDGGGIANRDLGQSGATVDIGNTIVKASALGANFSANVAGSVTSRGFNLCSDDGSGFLTALGDQINTDPMLGPLADNGGPTRTHLPLPGSPSIDQGLSNTIGGLTSDFDQRGFARSGDDPVIVNAPFGDGTDIGAVEVGAEPPPPPLPQADVLVSLGMDKTSVKQGELLTYTITVLNFGPEVAANVVVNDTLSSGSTFVSANANKGNFTAPPKNQTGVVTWILGDMENGDTEAAELVVTVIVKGKTTITNTASVTTDSEDPNLGNNIASITTSVGSGVSGGGGKKK